MSQAIIWKDDPAYPRNAAFMSRGLDLRSGLGSPRYLTQKTTKDGVTVAAGTVLPLLSGGVWKSYYFITATDVTTLDTGSLSNGKDYCVYLCDDGSDAGVLLISLNATAPAGYTSGNSRKIGGFHTLCANVGTIGGHTLTGYTANQVLPESVWDLTHRPKNASPNGMVYSKAMDIWVDIYLASGTGGSTASTYNATISDTRNWMDFCDDGAAVFKRLLWDAEFTAIATGSNEETNIVGSADPGTTGGKSDTAARRMISNIGCEDCCGLEWQWLLDNVYYPPSGTIFGAYGNLPGSKGSFYTTFTSATPTDPLGNADVAGVNSLLAGGYWSSGSYCGSRSRAAYYARWSTSSTIGGRFAAEPV
jgi:hypothetical protein